MEDNVKKFVNQCLEMIKENEYFMDDMETFEEEGYGQGPITSPIEQILHAAIITLVRINKTPESEPMQIGKFLCLNGISIKPQAKIGKYRVDFKITNQKLIYSDEQSNTIVNESIMLLVECDS